MRQCRSRSRFVPQALATAGVTAQTRSKHLERHASRQPDIIGKIDHAHAAATNLVADEIRTDLATLERPGGVVQEQMCRSLEHRRFNEVARAVVRVEQRRDLGPQRRIAPACLIEERVPRAGIALERGIEHRANLFPLFRSHPCARFQARVRATPVPDSTAA